MAGSIGANPGEIVYGLVDGFAVVARRTDAESLSRIWKTYLVSTWGEVRAILTPDEVERVRSLYAFDEEHENDESYVPPDSAPFNFKAVGAFDDGWWPVPLTFLMMDVVPRDIASRYGRVAQTPNGDALIIEGEHLETIANALRATGHTCIRDDALVRSAST